MTLTQNESSLLIHFLEDLSDKYSNAGCNDFDLKKFIKLKEERDDIVLGYHIWNGDEDEYTANTHATSGPDYRMMDFMLVSYLIARLQEESNVTGS